MSHASLTGLDLHQPFHYIQETDPGAVGAGLWWFKKSTLVLKYRNVPNTAWLTVSILGDPGVGGVAVTGITALAAGSVWADLTDLYDSVDPGHIIILPAENIDVSSSLQITKDIEIWGHPSGLSKLTVYGDLSIFGSGTQFMIGWDDSEVMGTPINVKLKDFTIEHDRVTVGPFRTNMITLKSGVASCEISGMTLLGATADVFDIVNKASNPSGTATNVSFHDNTVTEWWESVCLLRCGWADNVHIFNNICTTSSANPNSGISRPYGVAIDMEDSFGEFTNVTVSNNSFVSTVPFEENSNSLGLAVTMNDLFGDVRYDRISFLNNTIDGFYYGFYLSDVNTLTTGEGSHISVEGNHFLNSDSYPIYVRPWPNHASVIDRLILNRNHALVGGGPNFPQVDLTWCPDYNVEQFNNDYEGTWD